ncbi:MAG: flagellar basal body P-ring protein FlgI [Planctomycetota bacterium]|jgi:hypothetical protein
MSIRSDRPVVTAGPLTAVLIALVAVGCDNVERAGPQPVSSRGGSIELDVPRIMQGTVAAETTLLGYPQSGNWAYAQTVVRGYGLVVDLAGTGSRDIPAPVRAYMEAELSKGGFGSERAGWGHLTPAAVLNSLDTSVVIIEAVIPPAAIEGTKFDVRVFADPRSGTTSLEGGRLYTTPLRPGPLSAGGPQGFPLAEARGPIFINPFSEPGALGRDSINRTVGRVLNGGKVLEDMPLKLQLATPSHSRARHIQNAINTRFPQEPGQGDPTARGESDESISITVPPSYQQRTEEFVALLQHLTIRQSNVESVAMSVRRAVEANPAFAAAASLRWQALGVRSLPIMKTLYDYPEELPRLAALSAGANLDDALVINPLIDMTRSGSEQSRIQAVELLADMRVDPRIDRALRTLLSDEVIDVRLSAYEALVRRRDPYMDRKSVDGGKFVLDAVESDEPMIYITQVGQPRIVLFGKGLEVNTPLQMQAWSNRLMLKSGLGQDQLEVYYRSPEALQGTIHKVNGDLPSLIAYLAHTPSPESPVPGLALSYGETVGALHQIWRQGYIDADFKAEQDRILAAILRRERISDVPERPEYVPPEGEILPVDEAAPEVIGTALGPPTGDGGQ